MTRSPRPRQPLPPRPPRGLWARLALAWLLLALVAVPTVGRLHQVAHAGALEQARAGHAAASDSHAGLLQQLMGSHTPVDCLLLDQLALGDAAPAAALALPALAPPQAPPAPRAGYALARQAAPFQARGPPAA